MNKIVYIILLTISLFHHMGFNAKQRNYREKIKNFFCSSSEKVEQHEYNALLIESLSITNCNGNVTVHTGPKKSLFIRTISRARKQENLELVTIAIDESKRNRLSITTQCNEKKKNRVSVDFEIIVPASLNLELTITGNGDMSIKNVLGKINATAHGNISITNTKNVVIAQTDKNGSISIINPSGPVETQSYSGNITGENIAHNFSAHTAKGNIILACKKIPFTGWLDAKTSSGNIILALPADTNAQIQGHTIHGTFMSDYPILLKPYTTPLNKEAWKIFKQRVDGTLGSGDATIALASTSGNIKIVATKTT
jgi:DUF4097 and DUF4098 domain-containing protein YvlB